MINNKKIKALLCIAGVLLTIFQVLTILLADLKDYYLIHDWIFYGINYIIIILLILPYGKKRLVKWIQLVAGLILLTANTTFFYYFGNTNTVISKPENKQHEIILKEYKKMNFETIRLKRRWLVFGKKVDTLIGSSKYKAIEKGAYKIEWVSGDSAILTYQYQSDNRNALKQSIITIRNTDYISYKNVAVSLTGKWYEKNNPNNYFMYNQGNIACAEDGKLYYYTINDTEQQGVSSIMVTGDANKPSFTVVLNSDCIIGDDGIIKSGGTITISQVTLEKSDGKVYSRK